MNTKHKALTGLKITDEDQGLVRAVFSTFNVIDSDGDVTLPGAFEEGKAVRISAYNHTSWGGALPVGKGTIHANDEEAILEGQFFLDTAAGRDTFAVVKQMGELQEWSYGFDVIEAEPGHFNGEAVTFLKRVDVHEVSPVLLGAGVNTRTLAAKSRGQKLSDHIAAVVAEAGVVTERIADVLAKRSEKGKGLGAESADAAAELESVLSRLREQLAHEENAKAGEPEGLGAEALEIETRLAEAAARLRT